jgi:RNA polymerase sigma-70 factor, ECF subfamily
MGRTPASYSSGSCGRHGVSPADTFGESIGDGSRVVSFSSARRDQHAAGAGSSPTDTMVEDFETFYRREFRGVVALAYALSGSRHAAEDLAQDAFLAAHRRWSEISRYDLPLGWVRRVVANMSASVVRRRVAEGRALVRLAGRQQTVVAPLDEPDAEFWRAVRSLPLRQAQAVALHYLFDLSVVDVAATLEISEGTVKAHLHKARGELAKKLSLWEGVVE